MATRRSFAGYLSLDEDWHVPLDSRGRPTGEPGLFVELAAHHLIVPTTSAEIVELRELSGAGLVYVTADPRADLSGEPRPVRTAPVFAGCSATLATTPVMEDGVGPVGAVATHVGPMSVSRVLGRGEFIIFELRQNSFADPPNRRDAVTHMTHSLILAGHMYYDVSALFDARPLEPDPTFPHPIDSTLFRF